MKYILVDSERGEIKAVESSPEDMFKTIRIMYDIDCKKCKVPHVCLGSLACKIFVDGWIYEVLDDELTFNTNDLIGFAYLYDFIIDKIPNRSMYLTHNKIEYSTGAFPPWKQK